MTDHIPKPVPSMLDYVKMILEKVDFDPYLFEKELHKACRSLLESETFELQEWCQSRYGDRYPQALERCFGRQAPRRATRSA